MSNTIGLGPLELEVPLPDIVIKLASIFRASGRIFWPVFYLIVLATIWLTLRTWKQRNVVIALSLAFFIQVVDTSAGWKSIRDSQMVEPDSRLSAQMTGPFWDKVAERYDKVRHVPVDNHVSQWKAIAAYAGRHDLSTDAVYLARVDKTQLATAREKALSAVKNGVYEEDALYIVDARHFALAKSSHPKHGTLFTTVDDMHLIAPGWDDTQPKKP